MSSILETKGTPQLDVHYVRRGAPPVVGGYYMEHRDDDSLGEFLEDQEILLQSLQIGSRRQIMPEVGESSRTRNVKSQLERDADFARSLQEREYQLLDAPLSGTTRSTAANRRPSRPETSARGTRSKGLSDKLISYLPSFKYKPSRSAGPEECVICLMEYKNQDNLITLPCKHKYHSKCITKWLKISKACPVCTEKVFGP